tara:strand:- start:5151 stop:5915 length:765 start_codon:yes stop_codon:yes gene_type:complete
LNQDIQHYIHLLERGYEPEDALLVTSAKFPGFKHEPAAVNQADEASESPLDAGGGAAYNPYAPSPDVPQPLGELKLNGKKAWEYVQSKIEDIDVQRLRPSRRATAIGTSVGGFVLLVVALLVLANNGGPAVEGTWMNDQGQRFTFRSDATASWEDDSAAQWSQNGDQLVVLANHQGTTFTHTMQIEISDDGRAIWLLPTSIQDNDGTEYTEAPGYNPSCSMLIKSDVASTLDKYHAHDESYEDKAPEWCDLSDE